MRSAARLSSSRPERARYRQRQMARMVQLAVALDSANRKAEAAQAYEAFAAAEELQEILRNAGIESELEAQGPDDPLTVKVPEGELDAAQDAIEALTEPDDPIAD